MYSTENGSLVIENTKNGVIDNLKLKGNTKIVDVNGNEVLPGTEGAKLLSVGEDVDKIEVLSRNKNLFDGVYTSDMRIGTNGSLVSALGYNATDFIRVYGTSICGNLGNDNYFAWYDENKGFIKRDVTLNKYCNVPKGAKYVQIASNIDFLKLQIEEGVVATKYTEHKSNKKPLLYYNSLGELVPVPYLTKFDSVEKHADGKWYYHKKSVKFVLNGSEDWVHFSGSLSNVYHMNLQLQDSVVDSDGNRIKIICDKFRSRVATGMNDDDTEFISLSNNGIIRISINKTNASNLNTAKQWLQTNNVTVVYELAQEEVYEIAPLHLDSYENETMIMCIAGAISPRMEFIIKTSLNDIAMVNQELSNEVENQRVKLYENLVEKKSEVNSDDSLPVLVNSIKNVNTGRRWATGKASYQSIKATTSFSISCDFVPSILFVKINNVVCGYDGTIVSNVWLSNLESSFNFYNKHYTSFQIRGKVDNVSSQGFTITIDSNYNDMLALAGYFDWYAFE